jgi:hypothetical protein
MLLLIKSKGHTSNSPYSGFPNSPSNQISSTYFYLPEPDTLYQIQMGDPVLIVDDGNEKLFSFVSLKFFNTVSWH